MPPKALTGVQLKPLAELPLIGISGGLGMDMPKSTDICYGCGYVPSF